MYQLRVWLGSIIFAIGIAGAIWFIRNLFRSRLMRARLFYTMNPFVMGLFIVGLILGGIWIHSNLRLIPLIGLIAGVLIGWRLSR